MFLQMSEALKPIVSRPVYEEMRSRLQLVNPNLATWDQLSKEEQDQFGDAINFWLRGLGSNEVAAEWFARSGQTPAFFWQQSPGGADATTFIMAAMQALNQIIEQANQNVQS